MKLEKLSYENNSIFFLKSDNPNPLVQCMIEGIQTHRGHEIINSIVNRKYKKLLLDWKCKIADEVRKNIVNPFTPRQAAVSLSFFFSPSMRGKRKFDAENFIKPILDGVAKGLYSSDWDQERNNLKVKFNEDDSVFRWVYIERHDIKKNDKESVYVTVWEEKQCS